MEITPQLIWDVGTGYDLFTSLDVLHDPVRYGLRGQWAAGVRSRLPAEQREFLQEVMKHHQIWPIQWLASLPGPKDSATVLERLADMPAAQRLPEISQCYMGDQIKALLYRVAERGTWDEKDKKALHDHYQKMYKKETGKKKKIPEEDLIRTLTNWADTEAFGEAWLIALEAYYEVFFEEEETRILPVLEQNVDRAKELAREMPLLDLLNELSQGLRFDYEDIEKMKELTMIPSFWTTPLTLFMAVGEDHESWLFMFGARPASMSLVPGEVVPELLYQTLKALADPTRLRILRYLAEEPLTPAALARRLRLRPPTVIHHLDALRLARLVHVTISYQGRRYEARREAIDAMCLLLTKFLDQEPMD
jgi:DNA-binding transcriptional ArsR family regulator